MKIDNIFMCSRDAIAFVNPQLSRHFLRTVVARALAHPADYQSLQADLQSDIALLALQAGMRQSAQQLRALSTDRAQQLFDAWAFQGMAQRSWPEAAPQGNQAGPQRSSQRGLNRSRRSPVRSWLVGLRDKVALAMLRVLYRYDMKRAQAVHVLTYKAASEASDDLVQQILPGFRIDPDWIFQTGRVTHTGQRLVP